MIQCHVPHDMFVKYPIDPYYVDPNDNTDNNADRANQGNIYNNQGSGIAIYALENGADAVPQLIASMPWDSIAEEYTVDYSESDYKDPVLNQLNSQSGLAVDHRGKLYFQGRSDNGDNIRTTRFLITTHGDTIRPGDDFQLQFALADQPDITGMASEADLCAVYDHKMLWRANLYIDEGVGDWNNVEHHRWVEGNAWNYSFDGETLRPSSGGQTLNFQGNQEFTPVRNSGNISAVAYDFPDATGGGRDNNPGYNPNSIDSPFDFVFKMFSQRQCIQQFYSNMEDGTDVNLDLGGNLPAATLKRWPNFNAPNDYWMNYINEEIDGFEYKPYLPGIGLLNHSQAHIYEFRNDAGVIVKPQENWLNEIANNGNTYYYAGVDCVGLVLSSSSYVLNPYSWGDKVNQDTAERFSTNGQFSFEERERPGGNFSAFDSQWHEVIISREGIHEDIEAGVNVADAKRYYTDDFDTWFGPTEEDFRIYQEQFLRIRPGDIIRYDSSHIGIINSVDTQAITEALDISEMMRAVSVIESSYNQKINFVFKRNMLEGVVVAQLIENQSGSWHQDSDSNLRNWFVERIEVKDE